MPAGKTYTPLATTTLSSAAASVTFSSISGSYTDLVLVVDSLVTTSFTGVTLQLNSDTGSNYSWTLLLGDGSSASSTRSSNTTAMNLGLSSTSGRTNSIFQIQNYSNTTTNKTVLSRGNAPGNQVRTGVGLWRNTAAVTSVTVSVGSDTFISGSTFTLYGILAA